MTARLWGLVLFANIVGTLVFAAILQIPGVFPDHVIKALGALARQPFSGSFTVTVVRAMFAGWLIALMVWLLPSARSAQLVTILLITYVVAISKLPHIIAGSVEASYGVMTGAANVRGLSARSLRADLARQYDRRYLAGSNYQPRLHRSGNNKHGAAALVRLSQRNSQAL